MKSGRLGKRSIALLLCMTILLGSIISVNASELGNSDADQIVSTESIVTETTEETTTTETTEKTEVTEVTETIEATETTEVTETTETTEMTESTESTEIIEEDVPLAPAENLLGTGIAAYALRSISNGNKVVNTGESDVSVTIEHYLQGNPETILYADQTGTIAEEEMFEFTTVDDESDCYTLAKVCVIKDGESVEYTENLDIVLKQIITDEDITVRCIYAPTEGIFTNEVTFIDYDVKEFKETVKNVEGTLNAGDKIWVDNKDGTIKIDSFGTVKYTYKSGNKNKEATLKENTEFYLQSDYKWHIYLGNAQYGTTTTHTIKSINDSSNFASGYNTESNTFWIGATDEVKCYIDGVGWNVNKYDSNNKTRVTTGILKNLTGENYEIVNFHDGIYAADLFSESETNSAGDSIGKRVLDGYYLNFTRVGNSYTLKNASKDSDTGSTIVANAGKDFWPLDSNLGNDGKSNNHNEYFTTRYDFKFVLGDYKGALNYSFTGDDDLWVFLDGEIILDIGGIHAAASDSVNLWDVINNMPSFDYEKEHTITVILMERGGWESNCEMSFVMPNVVSMDSVISTVPRTDVTFTKVDSADTTIALEGAKFALYSGVTLLDEAVSDAKGIVTFRRLKDGTYTLKETAAPSGYELSEMVYTVLVANETTEKYTIKDANGNVVTTNCIGNKKITVSGGVNAEKTATLVDWDDRTYQITISAVSDYQSNSITEKTGPADIMLVLDVSGSMDYKLELGKFKDVKSQLDTDKTYYIYYENYLWDGYYKVQYIEGTWKYNYYGSWRTVSDEQVIRSDITRMNELKTAVNNFLDLTNEKSPNSRIGIATFDGENGYLKYSLSEIDTNLNAMKQVVNNLSANGGTSPAYGLECAQNELTNKKANNPQYVILFTDGEPTGNGSNWNETAANNAKNKADAMKESGVTLYTVGFALSEKADAWLETLASKGCALKADDTTDLSDIFGKISEEISKKLSVIATVTDVIDPRFDVLDDKGNVITIANVGSGVQLANGGVVKYDSVNSRLYVEWTDAEIPTEGNWENSIVVKAKNTYIGGNNVTTNVSPNSKITYETALGGQETVLPQPTVNVKIRFDAKSAEKVIFLGEQLQDAGVTKETLASLYDRDSEATGIQLGFEGDVFTSVDGNNISVKWFKGETEVSVEDVLKTNTEETYTVKITYTEPKVSTDESLDNTKNKCNPTATEVTGEYKVFIIDGQITIIKQIKASDFKTVEGDPIFTFKITGKNTGAVYYKTLRFSDITGSGNVTRETTITGLCKDDYTIEELTTLGYQLKSVSTDGSECIASVDNNQAVVEIGTNYQYAKVDDTYIATYGHDGKALFVNEKSRNNGKLTDTDVVKNSFVLGEEADESKTTHNADNKTVWNAYTTITTKKEEEE